MVTTTIREDETDRGSQAGDLGAFEKDWRPRAARSRGEEPSFGLGPAPETAFTAETGDIDRRIQSIQLRLDELSIWHRPPP